MYSESPLICIGSDRNPISFISEDMTRPDILDYQLPLAGALVAIIGQDHDMEQIEVIVSDNGSTDTTLAIAEGFRKAFPNFRYLYDPRPGQIVGWHRALSITKAEVIAFIDDDIRPNPQWANAAIEIFSDFWKFTELRKYFKKTKR